MLIADIEHGAGEHVVVNLLGGTAILEDEGDGFFFRRSRLTRLSVARGCGEWWWSGFCLLPDILLRVGVGVDGLRRGVVVGEGVCVAGINVTVAWIPVGIRVRTGDAGSVAAAIDARSA